MSVSAVYLGVVNEGPATSVLTTLNAASAGTVVIISFVANSTVTSVTDSVGNTYSVTGGTLSGPGSTWSGFAYSRLAKTLPAGGTITSNASGYTWLQAAAYSNVKASPFAYAGAYVAPASQGSVTTSASVPAGSLVIGVVESGSAGVTLTQPSTWNAWPSSESPQPFGSAWVLAANTGDQTYTVTASSAANFNFGVIAFPVAPPTGLAMLV